jgi:hypothetical protein
VLVLFNDYPAVEVYDEQAAYVLVATLEGEGE